MTFYVTWAVVLKTHGVESQRRFSESAIAVVFAWLRKSASVFEPRCLEHGCSLHTFCRTLPIRSEAVSVALVPAATQHYYSRRSVSGVCRRWENVYRHLNSLVCFWTRRLPAARPSQCPPHLDLLYVHTAYTAVVTARLSNYLGLFLIMMMMMTIYLKIGWRITMVTE